MRNRVAAFIVAAVVPASARNIPFRTGMGCADARGGCSLAAGLVWHTRHCRLQPAARHTHVPSHRPQPAAYAAQFSVLERRGGFGCVPAAGLFESFRRRVVHCSRVGNFCAAARRVLRDGTPARRPGHAPVARRPASIQHTQIRTACVACGDCGDDPVAVGIGGFDSGYDLAGAVGLAVLDSPAAAARCAAIAVA